jgi:hypothetical protein
MQKTRVYPVSDGIVHRSKSQAIAETIGRNGMFISGILSVDKFCTLYFCAS